jgi:hypothetical protein
MATLWPTLQRLSMKLLLGSLTADSECCRDQGQLKGVRAPTSDYPLYSPNDANFACNTGIAYKDNNVISIPAGAKVGAWWGHVIG